MCTFTSELAQVWVKESICVLFLLSQSSMVYAGNIPQVWVIASYMCAVTAQIVLYSRCMYYTPGMDERSSVCAVIFSDICGHYTLGVDGGSSIYMVRQCSMVYAGIIPQAPRVQSLLCFYAKRWMYLLISEVGRRDRISKKGSVRLVYFQSPLAYLCIFHHIILCFFCLTQMFLFFIIRLQ